MNFRMTSLLTILSIFFGFVLYILYSAFIDIPYEKQVLKTEMFKDKNYEFTSHNELGYEPVRGYSGYSDLAAFTEAGVSQLQFSQKIE